MGTWSFSPSLPAGLTAVTNDNTVTVKVVSVNSNNIGTYTATYTDDDGCKKSQVFTISNCSGGGCDENITFRINSETQSSKSTTISCDEPQIILHATVPSPTPTNGYLTFTASESGTFKFSGNSINYSLDNGSTWRELASDTYSPTVQAGSKIMWKASLTPIRSRGIGTFASTNKFTVGGNVMSLLYGDNFESQTSLGGKHSAFLNLFSGCTSMTSAENLSLPATTLETMCYYAMFEGCTSLTSVPQLPATTLASFCYQRMFKGCTSLTTAPTLPATALASFCYYYMFSDCTSLTTAPSLLATTLADFCYYGMFSGCKGLTTVPSNYLPATTLVNGCYDTMFYGCTSLTTAPSLLATTLAEKCYQYMFYGCTSLTTAPSLPATTLVDDCYKQMFYHCTNLNYIKAMFTTTPSLSYMSNWVNGVASSGTFVKNSAATWTSSCGLSTYPCNWAVETASS